MAKQVKGITRLNKAIERLKEIAEEVREDMDAQREWLEEKTDKYQESDAGEAFGTHLYEVEELLDEIDNLDPVDLEN